MDALDRLVTVGATRELDEEGSATGGCILATDEVGTKESEEVGLPQEECEVQRRSLKSVGDGGGGYNGVGVRTGG